MFDPDSYREQSRRIWGEMASGWRDRNEWMMEVTGPVNAWLVENLDPQPGQSILEVASGTGELGFLVAEKVGSEGRVISTDFSPAMVEVAGRFGEARGASNVEHKVLDAEQMDLDEASVDGVVCRWGYMLMADPAAALKESRRVLRPGGRFAFAVWASPEFNPWAAVPGMTLVQRGHMPPPNRGHPESSPWPTLPGSMIWSPEPGFRNRKFRRSPSLSITRIPTMSGRRSCESPGRSPR